MSVPAMQFRCYKGEKTASNGEKRDPIYKKTAAFAAVFLHGLHVDVSVQARPKSSRTRP